jgi:hypothetical protein
MVTTLPTFFYRYNYKWTRTVQDAISTVILCTWLGGMSSETKPGEVGRLLTLEDMGELFGGMQSLGVFIISC